MTENTAPRTTAPEFRTVRHLLLGYFAIGAAALIGAVLLRHHSAEVNSNVWGRSIAVVVSAPILLAVTARAARGSRGAYRRLRIVSIVATVAIAALVATPGMFPLWMRIDQAGCGLVMLVVAVLLNRPRHRSGAGRLLEAHR